MRGISGAEATKRDCPGRTVEARCDQTSPAGIKILINTVRIGMETRTAMPIVTAFQVPDPVFCAGTVRNGTLFVNSMRLRIILP
jgi:hypothetical protein